MGYAERNLAPGEAILYRAHYHWIIYRTAALLLILAVLLGLSSLYASRVARHPETGRWIALMAVVFLALAAGAFFVRWIRARADEFVLTSHRVIRKVGLIAREIQQAPVSKIQDITVQQGYVGRALGYGSVVLETASETGRLAFPFLSDPEAFRNQLWGQGTVPDGTAADPGRAPSRRLSELEELRRQGLVTAEEYQAKRREIVERL